VNFDYELGIRGSPKSAKGGLSVLRSGLQPSEDAPNEVSRPSKWITQGGQKTAAKGANRLTPMLSF